MSKLAEFYQRISFSWLNYVFDGISDRLSTEEAPELPDNCLAGNEKARRFSDLLSNIKRNSNKVSDENHEKCATESIDTINIYKALIAVFGREYLMLGIFVGFQAVFTFSGPLLLHKLVELTESGADLRVIVFYIALLVLSKISASLMNTQYTFGCGMMLVKVSSALKSFIFKKTLRLSTSSRRKYTAGNITNVYTVDIERVVNATIALHNIWLMPLQIILCMFLLYKQVSYAVFAGLGAVLFILFLNHRISLLQKAANEKNMEFKDLRMRSMSEVFGSMLIVKLNAWEDKFSVKILDSREEELKYVWINLLNAALSIFLLWMAPCLVSVTTILTYVKFFHGTVSASRIFTAIALFKMLQDPLRNLPNCITQLYQASTSAERIQSYCALDEKENFFIADNCFESGDKIMQQLVRKGSIVSEDFQAFWINLSTIDENFNDDKSDIRSTSKFVLYFTKAYNYIRNCSFSNRISSTQDVKYDELSDSSEHGINSVEMRDMTDADLGSLDDDDNKDQNNSTISSCRHSLESTTNTTTKFFSLHVPALHINPCDFIVVRGVVGSGKSSFLSALLGDMYLKCDNLNQYPRLFGSVSYSSQQPWIQNMSIKDNILFGLPYDHDKYVRVVDACCLVTDFEELPRYDETDIGEKGLNISGGQKARIALARAVYADTDIIILDDILAALDSIVGKMLFEKCILGLLSGKTRILVTHAEEIIAHKNVSQILEVQNGIIKSNFQNRFVIDQEDHHYDKRAIISILKCPYTVSSNYYQPTNIQTNNSDNNNGNLRPDSCDDGKSPEPDCNRPENNSYSASYVEEKDITEYSMDIVNDSIFEADSDLSMKVASVLNKKSIKSTNNVNSSSNLSKSKRNEENYSKLINEEARAHGKIDQNVFMGYINSMGGIKVMLFLGVVQSCWQILFVEADLYLSSWSNESSSTQHHNLNKNMLTYSLLSLGSGFVVLIRTMTVSICGYRAARLLFEKMLHSLMHAPMCWFDKNPSGRILNRVSDDQSKVDNNMPFAVGSMFATGFSLLGALMAVIGITRYLIFILIPLTYIYILVMNKYLKVSREIQRMTQTTQSPVLTYMSECTDGLYIIRAFGPATLKYCINRNEMLINTNSRVTYLSSAANAWFVLRIQLIGASVLLFIVVFTCVHVSNVSSGLVGLSISYGLSICNELQGLVMMWSWFENSMISPERIIEYIDIPVEGTDFQKQLYRGGNTYPEVVVQDENVVNNPVIHNSCSSSNKSMVMPKPWPSNGNISFNNVCFRYQPDSELVLKNITFEVEGGSKIGICGRTGSGKSTISLCLFRIAELTSGSIFIDGVDISTVDLFSLRSGLEIVPQNPVLFRGTLKNYLDPFNEFTYDEIFSSIKKCNLMDVLKKMYNNDCSEESDKNSSTFKEVSSSIGINYDSSDDNRSRTTSESVDSSGTFNSNSTNFDGTRTDDLKNILNSEIAENGSNLSVGERQIIVLCRAILRKAKFLVLDEATANVDFATDQHIQQVLRDEFQFATVFTIAHRIDTIINSDKVLVLSAGKVVEFDRPDALLKRDSSLFSELQSSSIPSSPMRHAIKELSSVNAAAPANSL